MLFAEVIVNVPIRRTFVRRDAPPSASPAALPDGLPDDDEASLQTFHYHLPPELEGRVAPGHLVWAPFGKQELQGVVLRLTATAPVNTRPLLRLARPEPVLTPVQLQLAEWIALTTVAPFAEAVKLCLPPGLLARADGQPGVRARRELKVRLAVPANEAPARLEALAKPTQQSRLLAALLAAPVAPLTWKELQQASGVKHRDPLRRLEQAGVVAVQTAPAHDDQISLNDPAAARLVLSELTGLDKYLPIVHALAAAGGGLWKSELYAQVATNLDSLRALQQAGLVALVEEPRPRDPLAGRSYLHTAPPLLTTEQQAVWDQVSTAFDHQAPSPFLLHGVTGSGKTEIYLQAIAEALRRGKQAIVLVPEIALTPQTVARFAGRFPGRVTVIHSELNPGERYDVWRAVRAGEYDIVVGPRSALFAPLARIGLIVIDEEHESTYKQDAEAWGSFKVFYDARRVARRLAELTGAVLIEGSATPSLDAYYAAEQGQFHLLSMPRRVIGHRTDGAAGVTEYAELPPVEIVDMRQELRSGNRSIFSRSLSAELYATLDAGEQAILFLNRRGTNTFIICRDCGHVEECARCEVPLTYHEGSADLVCHHCNRHYPLPAICPQCRSKRIKFFGAGTERIEEAVREIAPRARVLRWDADTTGKKGAHEDILRRFAAHEADILVGTQMIAKGLDLPLVTLVGVVAADVGLFLPDFRSSERTFQLLTQVAGRAGRSQRGGRVVIQTYRPEHHAIQAAAQHDYAAFYRRELAFRREHSYPPISRLARLIYWEKHERKAKAEAERMAAVLRGRTTQLEVAAGIVDVIGPAPAPFARFRGYYRWQILLRAADPASFLRGLDIPFGWRIDIDPTSTL